MLLLDLILLQLNIYIYTEVNIRQTTSINKHKDRASFWEIKRRKRTHGHQCQLSSGWATPGMLFIACSLLFFCDWGHCHLYNKHKLQVSQHVRLLKETSWRHKTTPEWDACGSHCAWHPTSAVFPVVWDRVPTAQCCLISPLQWYLLAQVGTSLQSVEVYNLMGRNLGSKVYWKSPKSLGIPAWTAVG